MTLGKPETVIGHPLDPCIVRVRATGDDSVVGAGFLAAADCVATCSHVVADAFGLLREARDPPLGEIPLDFPFLDGARALAKVVAWEPAGAAETGDIAILKLTRPAPTGAHPARLAPAQRTAGQGFEVYGFPPGADAGRWSYGVVRDRLPDGWVQAEGQDAQGYRVQPGYSGAPVWVPEAGVIGMVVGAERDEAARVGFLIPNELIVAVYPALGVRGSVTGEFAGLLDGLAMLPRAAATGLELFLREYVGRVGVPVPFGGREESLSSLDRWLRDSEAPYALLVAPAGRGKSALLTRWCVNVAGDTRADVAFVPLSIRFRTASEAHAVGLLGARLRHLTGRGGEPPTSPQAWLDEIQATLADDRPDRPPLLIVLDGVDEAVGWELVDVLLFPDEPGRGVKVVVSARELADRAAEDWRRLLSWDWPGRAVEIPLEPLDREGVAAVLRSLGNAGAALAERADIVAQLVRLSEGDPLLVRLYAEALRESSAGGAMMAVDSLPELPPGLPGFFRQWWRDQERQWGEEKPLREPRVRVMLGLLATALGPVLVDDVIAVAPTDELRDTFAVGDALEALERFVVGDGREHGWVFSHPRLAQYFRDALGRAEAARWDKRFIAYGAHIAEELMTGRRSPEEAPAYAIQWYGTHLRLTRAPLERFDTLGTPQWLKAWEALEGGEDGFLGDLRNAQRRADQLLLEGPDGAQRGLAVSRGCRFGLVASSITSLAGNVPGSLLRALVREELWTAEHALAYARRMPGDERRVLALAELAAELPDALLADALEAISAAGDSTARVQGVTMVAGRLPESLLTQALRVVDTLTEERDKAYVLVSLASHLTDDLVGVALSHAHALRHSYGSAAALAALAVRIAQPQRDEVLSVAVATAREEPEPEERAYALAGVARVLSPPRDIAVWEECFDTVIHISSNSSRSWALASWGDEMPDALVGRIPTILRSFSDASAQDNVISSVAGRLPEAIARDVLEIIGARADAGDRQAGLAALASVPSPALVREALSMARAAPEAHNFTGTLGTLARRLAALGFPDEALDEVLEAPRAHARPNAVGALAPELPVGMLDAAVEMTVGFDDPEDSVYREAALVKLAARLAECGRGGDAVGVASAIERPHYRLTAIQEVAPHLDDHPLEDAISIASQPSDEQRRGWALAGLSLRLVGLGFPERALDLAEAIEDRDQRLRTLAQLASELPRILLPRAEAATRLQSDELYRAQALAGLLPQVAVEDRAELYVAGLNAAGAVPSSSERADLLQELMVSAPPECVDASIGAARAVRDDFYRQGALAAVLPRLVELGARDTAVATAREARAIGQLVELMPPENRGALMKEAVQEVRSIRHALHRSQGLARLSALAQGPAADDLRAEALAAARDFAQGKGGKWALTAVLQQLPAQHRGPLLEEALREARGIEDPRMRARTLADLVPLVPDDEGAELAAEAVDAVAGISEESQRGWRLAALAPMLPPALLDRALAVADSICDDLWLGAALQGVLPALAVAGRDEEALNRALAQPRHIDRVLAEMGPHLTEAALDRALTAADGLKPYSRAAALAGLAPRLAAFGRPVEALGLVVTIASRESRAAALRSIAPALASVPSADLARAWIGALRTLGTRDRVELLSDLGALAPVITALGGPKAARATAAAVVDVGAWFP